MTEKRPVITLAMLKNVIRVGAGKQDSKNAATIYKVHVRAHDDCAESCEPTRAHPMFTAPQLGIRFKNGPSQLAVLDGSTQYGE